MILLQKFKEIKAVVLNESNSFVAITPVGTSSPLPYTQVLEIKKAYPKGSVTIKYVGGTND